MYQHSTSGAAYKEIIPTLNDKQKKVLEVIKGASSVNASINDKQIARSLGWDINRVTPRRGELLNKGFIYEYRIAPCPITNRRCSFWKVATKQLNIF